jgi:hypothetical protein
MALDLSNLSSSLSAFKADSTKNLIVGSDGHYYLLMDLGQTYDSLPGGSI